MRGERPEAKVVDLADVLATLERNRIQRAHLGVQDCDGEHPGRPCADPHCWQRDPDDVTPTASDIHCESCALARRLRGQGEEAHCSLHERDDAPQSASQLTFWP